MKSFFHRELRFLSVFAFLFLSSTISARQLTAEESLARIITPASRSVEVNITPDQFELCYTGSTMRLDASADYYVFNKAEGRGYVILSGDDRMVPVLGYTESGSFDPEHIAPGLRYWLECYQKETALKLSSLTKGPEINVSKKQREITPLLTTKWNQTHPYNLMCPEYDGRRSLTGCVATAMAQVMKYHRHPQRGSGSHTYVNAIMGDELTLDFSSIEFEWDYMSDSYDGSESEKEMEAVAKLMLACGISVEMMYTPDGSGSFEKDAVRALRNFFDYDKGIRLITRNSISPEQFEEIIETQLSTVGPIIWCGSSMDDRHAFVCDGRDEDGLYHFNWGWGGINDGYYSLYSVNGWDFDQCIIIDAKPDDYGETAPEGNMSIQAHEKTLNIHASLNMECELGLKARNIENKDVFYSSPMCLTSKTDGGNQHIADQEVDPSTFFAGLSDGAYRIYPVARGCGNVKWFEDYSSDSNSNGRSLLAVIQNGQLVDYREEAEFTLNVTIDKPVPVNGFVTSGQSNGFLVSVTNNEVYPIHSTLKVELIGEDGVSAGTSNCMVAIAPDSTLRVPFEMNVGKMADSTSTYSIIASLSGTGGFAHKWNIEVMSSSDVKEVDGIYYVVDNEAAVIVNRPDGKGYGGDVKVPDRVNIDGRTYDVMGSFLGLNFDRESVTSLILQFTALYPHIPDRPYYTRPMVNLKKLVLPEGITDIGDDAFGGSSSLTEVIFPASLKSIGDGAFIGCTALKNVVIGQGCRSIGEVAFLGCSGLESVEIGPGCKSIGAFSFQKCHSLKTLTIGEGCETIEKYAYSLCESLENISLPVGLKSIGERAFFACSSLMSLNIPRGVTSIGDGAFQDCTSLTELTLSESLTSIGEWAFGLCNRLKNFTFPSGIKEIGKRAFSDCKSIDNISIPGGIVTIGAEAFVGCKSIRSVDIGIGCESIGAYSFQQCDSLKSVHIAENCGTIGEMAFSYCPSLESVILEDGLSYIEGGAFYECAKLKDIEIPDGVKTIGARAFEGCRSMSSVTLPGSLEAIGENGFADNWSLTCINCHAETPPQIDNSFNTYNATVHVKKGSRDLYMTSDWNMFSNIVEDLDGSTRIKGVFADDIMSHFKIGHGSIDFSTLPRGVTVKIYDVRGYVLYTGEAATVSVPSGIYIVNIGETTRSIVIK